MASDTHSSIAMFWQSIQIRREVPKEPSKIVT